jgi:ATP-binding cassette, subfamily B, bacterial
VAIPLRAFWQLLAGYLRPQWARVTTLSAILFAAVGLQLLSPQLLRSFIDGATTGEPHNRLVRLALIFIGIALVTQVLLAFAKYLGEQIGWTATNNLRTDLTAHCLSLDQSFHKARTPGEMVERIDGDVNLLANFFSQFAIDLFSNLALMTGVLLLLGLEDWRLGLGMALFALISLAVLLRIRTFAEPYQAAEREVTAQFFGFLAERLAGIEDLRASGAEAHTLRRFTEHLRGWWPRSRLGYLTGASAWMATLVLFALGNALAFGLGLSLFRAGAITLGTVYLIFHYTELLRRPIEQIRTQLQDLQKAGASIGRVRELFALRSQLPDGPGAALPAGPLSVTFDGVTFGYDDEDAVLHDISLQIQPGEILAVLGRTGSGKTTLARLLSRLYDPAAGEVQLGGAPLRDATLAEVRRRVGVVTQDVQLFAGTVRDNLTFFNPAIPDEQLWRALDALGLAAWLRALPDGLDTPLAAGGGGLSAGEAQLLAFARLFLGNPGLVILDEASSRLDPATEMLIGRAVETVLRDRTGVIIAHRLDTVRRADLVLILDDGRIAEWGQRAALAADPTSRYAALLSADAASLEVLA